MPTSPADPTPPSVDESFPFGDEIAIEVKGTENVSEKHLSGLKALSEEMPLKRKIVVSMDSAPRRIGTIDVLPVGHFLRELWEGG